VRCRIQDPVLLYGGNHFLPMPMVEIDSLGKTLCSSGEFSDRFSLPFLDTAIACYYEDTLGELLLLSSSFFFLFLPEPTTNLPPFVGQAVLSKLNFLCPLRPERQSRT